MSGRNHPRMKCHIPRMNCPIWLNKSNIQFLRYCGELSTTGVNIQAVANKDLVWNMIALQLAGKSADLQMVEQIKHSVPAVLRRVVHNWREHPGRRQQRSCVEHDSSAVGGKKRGFPPSKLPPCRWVCL